MFKIMFLESLFFLGVLRIAYSHECILHQHVVAEESKSRLFDVITNTGESFQISTPHFVYAVGLCQNFSKHANAAVVKTKLPHTSNQQETILGRYNDSDIAGNDHGVILTFGSGDIIVDNSTCNGTRWSSLIWIECQVESKLELMAEMSAGCMAQFHLTSPSFCPQQGSSWLATVFYLFIIGLILYFVIGILYRRFVLGAKGYEQTPHYSFWRKLPQLPVELVRKVLMGDSQSRSAPAEPLNPDPADEPLLSP